jgi:hypothetical protein
MANELILYTDAIYRVAKETGLNKEHFPQFLQNGIFEISYPRKRLSTLLISDTLF